jgi:hypothetical protein
VASPTPRPLYPRERDPVPIVQEAGWAPGSVWTAAENLAPTGIRSPDRPARSESLYRLRYPGPRYLEVIRKETLQGACVAQRLALTTILCVPPPPPPRNTHCFHCAFSIYEQSHQLTHFSLTSITSPTNVYIYIYAIIGTSAAEIVNANCCDQDSRYKPYGRAAFFTVSVP